MKNITLTLLIIVFISTINAQTIGELTNTKELSVSDKLAVEQSDSTRNINIGDLRPYYDIRHYGALGDNSTDNTSAIQAAIDAANVSGGVVFVPEGVFLLSAVRTYANVSIRGVGNESELKGTTADTLVKVLYTGYTSPNTNSNKLLNNLKLNGNDISLVGLYAQVIYDFKLDGLIIQQFVDKGISFNGSLVGTLSNSRITENNIGFYATEYDGFISEANAIIFNQVSLTKNDKYGIEFEGGSQLTIFGSTIENNGVLGDSTTGGILFTPAEAINSSYYTNGLHIYSTWFEANKGNVIHIKEGPGGKYFHTIQNSAFWFNQLTNAATIKVSADTMLTNVWLINNNIQDGSSLRIIGANANVINMGTQINNVTLNTGSLKNIINSEGYISPDAGDAPTDTATPNGWAVIYINGIEKRIPYYD